MLANTVSEEDWLRKWGTENCSCLRSATGRAAYILMGAEITVEEHTLFPQLSWYDFPVDCTMISVLMQKVCYYLPEGGGGGLKEVGVWRHFGGQNSLSSMYIIERRQKQLFLEVHSAEMWSRDCDFLFRKPLLKMFLTLRVQFLFSFWLSFQHSSCDSFDADDTILHTTNHVHHSGRWRGNTARSSPFSWIHKVRKKKLDKTLFVNETWKVLLMKKSFTDDLIDFR